MATVELPHDTWQAISDGLDKLLDLEAHQAEKEISDGEFTRLEALLGAIKTQVK